MPALPSEWPEGQFDGVIARGGFELDFGWKNNAITELEILSKAGIPCSIKTGKKIKVFSDGKQVKLKKSSDGIVGFNTVKSGTYTVEGM